MRKLLAVMVLTMTMGCSGGGGGGTVEGFCAELKTDNDIFMNLGDAASDSDQAIQLFENLTKKAPSEIKGDMETLLTFLKSSVTAARDLSADPSASRSSSRDSQISAASSSVQSASEKLTAFATDKCHLDLGATSSSKFSAVASSISN